jgi:hypothetical protein
LHSAFFYRDVVLIIPFLLPSSFCSLGNNELGTKGGIAIANALKINSTITTIGWGSSCTSLPPCCIYFFHFEICILVTAMSETTFRSFQFCYHLSLQQDGVGNNIPIIPIIPILLPPLFSVWVATNSAVRVA